MLRYNRRGEWSRDLDRESLEHSQAWLVSEARAARLTTPAAPRLHLGLLFFYTRSLCQAA
jgi:hypothetical protein